MKIWTAFKVAAAAFFFASTALAQTPGTLTNHAFLIGKGAGQTGFTSLLCGSAQLAVGQSAADPICRTVTGDVTITAAGVTAIGSGKVLGAMLGAMTSAELRTALSDETGTGLAYFAGGALGTPASGTLTNATGLPISGIAAVSANTLLGNFTGSSAVPTATNPASLTHKASPTTSDIIVIADVAASNALKYATLAEAIAAVSAGVTTLNGASGAVNWTITVQTFCASGCTTTISNGSTGTYTPTAGTKYARMRMVAPGGGSGGVAATSATQQAVSGGGGCGGYAEGTFSAATIGVSQTVTIGAVGTAGTAGNNAGGTGGATSVGTLVVAAGGVGGGGSAASAVAAFGNGGAGGAATAGSIQAPGGPGGWGIAGGNNANSAQFGGNGCTSPWGGGGAGQGNGSSAGTAGAGFGSGGGGASGNNSVALAGGAGSPAKVVIEDYVIN